MKELFRQWWALREDKSNKIRYDLLPLEELKKLAIHYTKWGKVHWDRNWEWWDENFMEICKQSAWRHFMQRQMGESDEDHVSACIFNMRAYEFLKTKNYDIKLNKLLEELKGF